MELSFSELRTKEVVNTADGRRLGRVCDIVFCYPENRVIGIVVPGSKGFSLFKNELFIEMRKIVKIGGDVVLVNIETPKPCPKKQPRGLSCCPPPPPPHGENYGERRSYEEYE